MNHFYFIFLIAGIFACLLIVVLLIRFGQKQRLASSMLCVCFISLAWYALTSLLFSSGEIRHYPNLYNKGNPLYYLFAPAAYLYVRLLVSPERGLKKKDLLHLIPSLLALIDILPYAFKDAQEKQHIVNLVAQDPSWNFRYVYAFVPQKVHYVLRACQMVIYVAFQWKFTFTFIKTNPAKQRTKYWLYCFNTIVSLLIIAIHVMMISGVIRQSSDLINSGAFPVFISIGIFVLSICLFFWPQQLYEISPGELPDNVPIAEFKEKEKTKGLPITPQMIDKLVIILEENIQKRQLYRMRGLTIHTLAMELNISPRNLSLLLNQHYKLRFNDFINNYRIEYIKGRIRENNWQNITLEALADEAGFSSRTTFYAAFKRNTGLSPSEFMVSREKGR